MIGTVEAVGEQTVRSRWTRGNDEPTISATSAPTPAEDDEAVPVQPVARGWIARREGERR